jgi:RNA polymerase sigma-70 factor, ECF subfamily
MYVYITTKATDRKEYLALVIVFEVSETELVVRAQGGDRNAFSELVRIHAQGVLNVIFRMCGDAQVAEDAAQETFIRAWSHLDSFRTDHETTMRNWLYRIGLNTATDMLRKEKRILPGDVEDFHLADPQLGPEGVYLQEERTALVQEAISSLPDASRAVLVLKEYEGLSYREIADALDIPIGTVMSRLNYARRILKEKLEGQMVLLMEAEHV